MIETDAEDRNGVPRHPNSRYGRRQIDREKVVFAVSRNLMSAHTNAPSAPLTYERFFELVTPLYAEILWNRDRIELLEARVQRQRGRLDRLYDALGEPRRPQADERDDDGLGETDDER